MGLVWFPLFVQIVKMHLLQVSQAFFSFYLIDFSVQKSSVHQAVWLYSVQFLTKMSKYITSSLNCLAMPLMTQSLQRKAAAIEAQPNSGDLSVICSCRQFLTCRAKHLFALVSFPLSFALRFLFPKED